MQSDHAVAKPSLLVRAAKEPHLFSVICKTRLFYSRHLTVRPERAEYRRQRRLFTMSPFESEHYNEVRTQGFTVLHDFFDVGRIDLIYEKADRLFRDLQVYPGNPYTVRKSWEGLTYRELESSEKFIPLKDPLLNVPECIEIIFNESILKIVANVLRYMPP